MDIPQRDEVLELLGTPTDPGLLVDVAAAPIDAGLDHDPWSGPAAGEQ